MTNQDNRSKGEADPSAGSTASPHATSSAQAGQDLRHKAEMLAGATPNSNDNAALSPEEIRKTLHELRVYRIELEMQNEELRRAQAEIEAARDRYYDLYDLAPVGYCTLSEQGLILEANLTAATLLRTPRGTLVKQPISRFILEDDQDTYYLHRKTLFETRSPGSGLAGEPQDCELRLVTADGAVFWAHLTATIAHAADGSPVCRAAISDIDERQRAGARLADQKRRLDSIIRGTNVGTWEWNVQSGETNFNERWADITGYTLDELGPTSIDTWMRLCHPDDLKESERLLNECFSGRSEYYQCECRMQHKDGSCVWVLDRGRVSTWTVDGRPEWMYGTHQDVTQRKIAEQALHKSEERFRSIYDTSPIGIELYDAHGSLVLANQACLDIFGVSDVAQINGFGLFEDPNVTDAVKARLRRGETAQYECTFDFELVKKHRLYDTHRSGTMDLDVLITPMNVDGEVPFGYLVHVQDTTERLRLERRLQTLERHESLKQVTGSIAHLFNNQLAAVIGFLDLLSQNQPLGATGSECLKEARTAAQRAAETSGLMLTLLGQSQGSPELVDLVAACRQRLAGLEVERPMGAELFCDLPDSGPVIRVDRSHLDVVISALVTNAWESLGKAGEIRVSISSISASDIPDTHRFPLDWEPGSEHYACLRVADTGCGMNATTIGRVFDPFFTEKFTGRGLGLAVVLGIVRASEGCVTVDSEPGRGSVFQVMWPLTSEDVPRVASVAG